MTPPNSSALQKTADELSTVGNGGLSNAWIEVLPFGAACFDPSKLQVIFTNSQFKKWFGQTEADTPSLPQVIIDQLGESRIRATLSEVSRTGAVRSLPIEFKSCDKGKRIAGLLRISPAEQFQANTVLLLIEDISAQKKSQVLGESVARLQDDNLKRLAESRANMQRVLEHLPQSFLLFNRHGEVTHTFSALAERLFPAGANQKNIRELIQLTDSKYDSFFSILFEEIDPGLLNDISPREIQIRDRLISLRFIRLVEDGIENQALCVLEDVTEVRTLQNELERKERIRYQILNAVMHREPFLGMTELIRALATLSEDPVAFRRQVHALKGNLAFFGFQDLATACHQWEELVEKRMDAAAAFPSATARDLAKTLNEGIAKFLHEQSAILRLDSSPEGLHFTVELERIRELKKAIDARATPAELTAHLQSWISLPIQQSLGWLNGVWLSTLETLGKKGAPIEFSETPVKVSPHCYRDLFGMLPLAIRNAADHGIEPTSERQRLGKSPEGHLKITLDETQKGGQVFYRLDISDDGAGVAWDKIRKNAQTNQGPELSRWSPQRLLRLVTTQAVSTKDQADEISGRGIGLGTLYEAVEKKGGSLDIESRPGEGTRLRIEFPKFSCFGD
jgi:two-component system chemotaxis sensor kinase CheA